QAKRIAAALGYIGLTSLDRVGFVSVTDKVTARLAPTRGRGRVFRILRFLAGLEAGGSTDLGAALRSFVAQHRRRGLAVLLTDLYDPSGFEAGINVLRYSRFEICVIHLVSEEDTRITARGDLTVVDVETGEAREVTVTPNLAQELTSAAAERQQRIARFCAGRGIPYFAVDPATPFDDVVLRVLRQGGLLS